MFLVRHAHADWTPDENRPLSNQGRDDAARLADLLQDYPLCAIYTSPYRRAEQTVRPLAVRLALPITIEPDLRERNLGNGPFEDFYQAVAAVWEDTSYAHPGGESNLTAQQRGLAVIHQLKNKHPGDDIVISTHGNLMALILQYFEPSIDFEFWKSLTMPDVYVLNFDASNQGKIDRVWSEEWFGSN